MHEISVKDKKYVKAKLIARELGYTNDYIGQLCRSGKIHAELVGRTWYVDPDSIKSHKQTRYRSSKASTRRELQADVIRAIHEQQANTQEHFYGRHTLRTHAANIAYETDESDLVPLVKKTEKRPSTTELAVELADAEKVSVKAQNEKKYNFEAPKREEVKFFGTLKVTNFITEVPVEAEESKPEKVVVKASGHHKPIQAQEIQHPAVRAVEEFTIHTVEKPIVAEPRKDTHVVPIAIESVPEEEVALPLRYRVFTVAAFIGGLLLAAICIGLEATITATADQVVIAYSFAMDNLSALIYAAK